MPIRTAIWKVGPQPQLLVESSLGKERLLEDMIVADPRVLSDEWMLIGSTGGQRLRRTHRFAGHRSRWLTDFDRTQAGSHSRDVVAQALDYAGWVEKLRAEEIAAIYSRFAPGRSLTQDFRQRFRQDLDEETLNQSHQIIIVASSLDDSTERIVAYLSERDVPINVLCFQVFTQALNSCLAAPGCLTRFIRRLQPPRHL